MRPTMSLLKFVKRFGKKKPIQDSGETEPEVTVRAYVEVEDEKRKEYVERLHQERAQRMQSIDVERDVKDVAKLVRQYIKQKHPTCKFSVFIERDPGDDLCIHLMAAPFPAFGPGWSKSQLRHGDVYLSPHHYNPGLGDPYGDSRQLTPQAMEVIADVVNYAGTIYVDIPTVAIGKEGKPFVQTG